MVRIAGKIPFTDMGMTWKKLPVGLLVYAGAYIILNLVLFLLNAVMEISAIWYPYWKEIGSIDIALGNLLAQIFGNVLFEEIYYRGFLWAQFSIKFTKMLKNKPVLGLNIGALLTNTLFALMHIPNRILNGILGWDLILSLLILLGIGYLFSAVYLITENLFAAMAIHVLLNVSFVLFYPIFTTDTVILIILGLMLIIWATIRIVKRNKTVKNMNEGELI
jgi:membrane protease YdiL (CAAX protease family)